MEAVTPTTTHVFFCYMEDLVFEQQKTLEVSLWY